jgi:hypothetical protein
MGDSEVTMEPAAAQLSADVPDHNDLPRQVDMPEQDDVPDHADLARTFADYAKAARGTAIKNHTKGDTFGENLAASRADVYDKAAELMRQLPPTDAANEMMNRAKAAHIRTPPLINFDSAGMQYATARAWQFCAWKIDPSLPEVAPKWD